MFEMLFDYTSFHLHTLGANNPFSTLQISGVISKALIFFNLIIKCINFRMNKMEYFIDYLVAKTKSECHLFVLY